jgi:hypothetical protein
VPPTWVRAVVHYRRVKWREVALVPVLLAAALVALVALVSWPVSGTMHPQTDQDGAWQIALRQALHDGTDYGPDLLFTYGPLGFLSQPLLVYPWSARLAFAWAGLTQLVLVATLLWGLRHAFRFWMVASLFAIPLAAALGGSEVSEVVIAFIGAVALVGGRVERGAAQAAALGLGALAGVMLLLKLNTGVTVAALGVVAVAAVPAPRRAVVGAYAGGAIAALAVGWIATGQSLNGIVDYVLGSLGIMSGFSEAMISVDPLGKWDPWWAILLGVAGLAVVARAAHALPRRERAGVLALWTVLAFTSFKAGFVRQEPGHISIFFSSLLGGIVAFGWAPHRQVSAYLVGAVFALAMLAFDGPSLHRLISPLTRARNFADEARLLSDGSDINAGIAAGRRERAAVEQFDGGLLAAIGDRPLHVEPTDSGLVWSHGLRWRPLPVFQSYSAYTSDLDDRNAASVRAPGGPAVIVREQGVGFDNRNPSWESPRAMRDMLCNFRAAAGPSGRWIVLARTAPRCGAERPLATVDAKLGVPVQIPPAADASSVVFVRIDGIQVSGLERLRTFLYRARQRTISLDHGVTKRLIPGTAADGLVLRVPVRVDFPKPFQLDQATDTLTVREEDRRGDLKLRFFAMPIR